MIARFDLGPAVAPDRAVADREMRSLPRSGFSLEIRAMRDTDHGGDFEQRLATLGITGVRTPPRSPKANAIGERLMRSIRTECLDHIIVVNEAHLVAVLAELAGYHNRHRPHRSLRLQSPVPSNAQSRGRVISRLILGGLHHFYVIDCFA